MKITDVTITPKIKAVLKDKTRYKLYEGVTGSGKSFIAGLEVFFNINNASARDTQFIVAGQAQSTIEKVLIDNPASFYNIFPSVCKYVRQGIGGAHIEIQTVTGIKKLYFVGYKDKARWKDVLGLTISGIWIEEVNIADDDFLRECFTRASRTNAWLIATCNGETPDKVCYVDFFNKGRPHKDYAHQVPRSTMDMLIDKPHDPNFSYWFWHFEDNPSLTEKQIQELYSIHPKGSFFYNTKILGIRAETEGVLYGHLLSKEHDIDKDKINYNALISAFVGLDVGSGGKEGTAKGNAKTVVTLSAVTMRNQRAVVIDVLFSEQVEHIKLIEEVEAWLKPYYFALGMRLKGIYIDNADRTLIETWRKNKRLQLDINGSIKQNKFINAQTRVSFKEQLILQQRLLFSTNENAQKMKGLLAKVKGKNGEPIDENMLWNDAYDSLDYSLTPRYHELLGYRSI